MVIIGMFSNRTDAEAAVRDLKTSGFSDERIGVAMRERLDGHVPDDRSSANGGILGGLIGLLGSLLVAGVGAVTVGGLFASALTGNSFGASTGGLLGLLLRMGVPDADARHFEEGLYGGDVLIAVNAFTRSEEVVDIFRQRHADFGPSGTTRYATAQTGWGYVGEERRRYKDPNYVGVERRMATA